MVCSNVVNRPLPEFLKVFDATDAAQRGPILRVFAVLTHKRQTKLLSFCTPKPLVDLSNLFNELLLLLQL